LKPILKNGRLVRKFTQVYKKNLFNGAVSLSGNGSDLSQTVELSLKLPSLIQSLGVKTFLDIPCGDLYWMSKINLDGVNYTGADIVPDLVNINSQKYGSPSKNFIELDLSKDVPPEVDLIFCRDLLVHLSTSEIKSALRNIVESKSIYLAMTTFTDFRGYRGLRRFTRGVGWRPINFQMDPWMFQDPLYLINEKCSEENGLWGDKAIGIWRISDLPRNF
jgi:hypothetical protein